MYNVIKFIVVIRDRKWLSIHGTGCRKLYVVQKFMFSVLRLKGNIFIINQHKLHWRKMLPKNMESILRMLTTKRQCSEWMKTFLDNTSTALLLHWKWWACKVWMRLTTAMLIPFVFLSSPGLSITWENVEPPSFLSDHQSSCSAHLGTSWTFLWIYVSTINF